MNRAEIGLSWHVRARPVSQCVGVRIGAQEWPKNMNKPCMSGGFYKSFGRLPSGVEDCEPADRVLLACCNESTTLLTGGPLHNLGAALRLEGFSLGRWVAQGGFAGEGVVPRDRQMEKFAGKTTCPTWNFNGNVVAAHAALGSAAIRRRVLVSKNVCHRSVYDAALHAALAAAVAEAEARGAVRRCAALRLVHTSMETYLQHKPGGKKMHDPLALATALNEAVCQLAEVDLFREAGGWGARLSPGSSTWISVDYDDEAFRQTLLCEAAGPAIGESEDGARGCPGGAPAALTAS